jgi:hypothetical protein
MLNFTLFFTTPVSADDMVILEALLFPLLLLDGSVLILVSESEASHGDVKLKTIKMIN